MFEEIIDKLKNNINSELSIKALRDLCEIDGLTNIEFSLYRNRRNNYNDLCKIFGKEFVARTSSEIDENTICYVGNLCIGELLPTYNLKYIYGYLSYNLNRFYNLDNLEIVYDSFSANNIETNERLDNLTRVYGIEINDIDEVVYNQSLITNKTKILIGDLCISDLLNTNNIEYIIGNVLYDLDELYNFDNLKAIMGAGVFPYIKSAKGLNNIKVIKKSADFYSLKKTVGLEKLSYIGLDAYFHSLENAECLKSLEVIGGNAFFHSLKSSKGLENLKVISNCAYFDSIEDADSINCDLYVGGIEDFNGMTLNQIKKKKVKKRATRNI